VPLRARAAEVSSADLKNGQPRDFVGSWVGRLTPKYQHGQRDDPALEGDNGEARGVVQADLRVVGVSSRENEYVRG